MQQTFQHTSLNWTNYHKSHKTSIVETTGFCIFFSRHPRFSRNNADFQIFLNFSPPSADSPSTTQNSKLKTIYAPCLPKIFTPLEPSRFRFLMGPLPPPGTSCIPQLATRNPQLVTRNTTHQSTSNKSNLRRFALGGIDTY